jgi:hypothetical protein
MDDSEKLTFQRMKRIGLIVGSGLLASSVLYVLFSYLGLFKVDAQGVDVKRVWSAVLVACFGPVALSLYGFHHCLQQRKWNVADPKSHQQILRAFIMIMGLADFGAITGLIGFLMSGVKEMALATGIVGGIAMIFHTARWPAVMDRFQAQLIAMGQTETAPDETA